MRLPVGSRKPGRTSTPRVYWRLQSHPLSLPQPADKAAKTFLTFHDVTFRKTDDLNELGGQCAELDESLSPLFKDASDLNDYAIVFRYLDAAREPNEPEAMVALEIAGRVFEVVNALMAE
jgi:HEPN domain-containing protein